MYLMKIISHINLICQTIANRLTKCFIFPNTFLTLKMKRASKNNYEKLPR